MNQSQWPNTMLTATINEPESVTEHHAYCYHQWTRVSDRTPCLLLPSMEPEHTMLTGQLMVAVTTWLTATINEPESVTEHHAYCYHQRTRVSDRTPCLLLPWPSTPWAWCSVTVSGSLMVAVSMVFGHWLWFVDDRSMFVEPESVTEHHAVHGVRSLTLVRWW